MVGLCIYCYRGTSYLWIRSPWSNEYDPPLEDGTVPSAKLRKLEIAANEAFDTYRDMSVRSSASTFNLLYSDDSYAQYSGITIFLCMA